MTARRWIRWVAATAAFVCLPLLVAAVRLREFDRRRLLRPQQPLSADDSVAVAPAHDPAKPTVAIGSRRQTWPSPRTSPAER